MSLCIRYLENLFLSTVFVLLGLRIATASDSYYSPQVIVGETSNDISVLAAALRSGLSSAPSKTTISIQIIDSYSKLILNTSSAIMSTSGKYVVLYNVYGDYYVSCSVGTKEHFGKCYFVSGSSASDFITSGRPERDDLFTRIFIDRFPLQKALTKLLNERPDIAIAFFESLRSDKSNSIRLVAGILGHINSMRLALSNKCLPTVDSYIHGADFMSRFNGNTAGININVAGEARFEFGRFFIYQDAVYGRFYFYVEYTEADGICKVGEVKEFILN